MVEDESINVPRTKKQLEERQSKLLIQKQDYVPAQQNGETEFENYRKCIVFVCFSLFKRLDRVTKSDIQNVNFHARITPNMFEKRRQLENFIEFSLGRFLFQFCQMENQKFQRKEKFDQFSDKIELWMCWCFRKQIKRFILSFQN